MTQCLTAADDRLVIHHSDNTVAWHSFVTRVNNSLNDLQLEFRPSDDELTGRKMYALVNRKDDAIAQMASGYSPVEIAYFKAIIEQIMLAPNEAYSVSSLAALREVNALKTSMSKTQAEVVLSSFVAKGWLFKSKRGRYSLSTRTLVELSLYLKDTYPDEVNECTICMELVTRGVACLTMNCKTRMHYHCFTPFRITKSKCPACDEPWPQDAGALVPVGEMAVKDGQVDGRRQVRRKSPNEEDEETHDEEPSQPSQSQAMPRTQRSRRGKAKQEKMIIDQDDEAEEDNLPKRSQPSGTRRARRN